MIIVLITPLKCYHFLSSAHVFCPKASNVPDPSERLPQTPQFTLPRVQMVTPSLGVKGVN